jgi:hypothetical protein
LNLTRIENMGKDAATLRHQFHARLGQMARELAAELYPDGLPEGTTFSELEEIAGALADEMARQLIEGQVQAHASAESPPGACPSCQASLCRAPTRPRELTTTRGQVAWTQPTLRCPRCRRAFSPSGPGVGP